MITVYLTDFSHKKFYVKCFPYPVALVASYALREFAGGISIDLFKEFDEFRDAVKARKPDVVAFSNYMWNGQLGALTAELVKREIPGVVCIMGGPNYDADPEVQQAFLEARPAVDFYVFREGEVAFTSLLKHLISCGMDSKGLKSARVELPSVHYLDDDGNLVRGELHARLKDLDEVPSPYLTGILDKFFDQDLSVLAQRARGCPFACTFCGEGVEYYNRVAKFSTDRFESELRYCAERLRNKPGRARQLILAEANFGMFLEDEDVAERLARIRQEYGWPEKIDVATGKNRKERILSVVRKVNEGGTSMIRLTASVQSTDSQVLQNVKRSNISVSTLVKNATKDDPIAYGEVILGLPGDSVEAHTKTIKDLIDDGIKKVQPYPLVLLPGTEMASLADRKRFGYRTAFRLMPGAYGIYEWEGERLQSFEAVEVVIANNSLSFDEYIRCCEYDLIAECFYNNGLFDEYTGLLEFLGLSVSGFVDEIFALRKSFPHRVAKIFREFADTRTNELWKNRADPVKFYNENPRQFDELLASENRGSLATIKSILVFSCMEEMNQVACRATVNYLERSGQYGDTARSYLSEASMNSLARKRALLDPAVVTRSLHYDFPSLHEVDYKGNPSEFFVPDGIDIVYKPNRRLQSNYEHLKKTVSDETLIWRKLLYETRVDRNDDFCRLMERDGAPHAVRHARKDEPLFASTLHATE